MPVILYCPLFFKFLFLFILSRRCLDLIINKIKILPEYFAKFCSILKSHKDFTSLVTSFATSYIIYNHGKEIQEYIQIDDVLLYLNELLDKDENSALHPASKNTDRNGMSREEYFVSLLKIKSPNFIKRFMEYLALENSHCPNHIELYQLLKSLIDSLQNFPLPKFQNLQLPWKNTTAISKNSILTI